MGRPRLVLWGQLGNDGRRVSSQFAFDFRAFADALILIPEGDAPIRGDAYSHLLFGIAGAGGFGDQQVAAVEARPALCGDF